MLRPFKLTRNNIQIADTALGSRRKFYTRLGALHYLYGRAEESELGSGSERGSEWERGSEPGDERGSWSELSVAREVWVGPIGSVVEEVEDVEQSPTSRALHSRRRGRVEGEWCWGGVRRAPGSLFSGRETTRFLSFGEE